MPLNSPMDTSSVSSEGESEPVLTPQSSMTLSPRMSGPPLHPRPEDIPVPSIESPTIALPEPSGEGIPRTSSFSDPYHSTLDQFRQVNLSPFGDSSPIRQSGEENGSFTYRSLHNTTPEPTFHAQQTTRANHFTGSDSRVSPGNVTGLGALQSGSNNGSTNILSHVTNFGASSVPVQPPNLVSSSGLGVYDTNTETAPDKPYFDKEFQVALRKGKVVARRVADILSTCDLAKDRESHVFSMIQTANELYKFDAPSVCTIGIVGDSGVGKSSLINSLLDEADLARTAGLGAACTSVVTEYRLRKQEHTSKYTIEIDRMTDIEIEEELRELLWSYRYFHIYDLDEKEITADEQNRLEDQSKLAWDTLRAAFGSKRRLTHAYLQDSSVGAEERIQQTLKSWTTELQWPGDSYESGWVGSADTVEECNRKTQQFLTGNLWPFIKVIRIFLSSQVLKSGAILADLPGFHDTNNARVKAAEDYMYGCDEIFVVADITRVGTNKNVESVLEKSLGTNLRNGRPSQGIALVCTKSEDLDVDEIREKFFGDGRNVNAARVTRLERMVEEAEANDARAGALRQRDDAQDELDYIYMTARNGYIEELIRTTHAQLFRARPLSVFCISNKMYKKNRRRVKVHDLPIKGSGIPALRRHCHKIPAQAQFRIGHHFLTVRLKGLVERLQLWLIGGSQETMPNDATVQRLLETLQDDLQKNASTSISAAGYTQREMSNHVLIQPMTRSLGDWTEYALEVCNEWNRLDQTQIAAFCRKYGSWGSGKVDYTEWNLNLIESMADTISPWWDVYAEGSAAILDEIQNKILTSLDALASQVKDFHGAPLFAEALVTKSDSIKYLFADMKENGRTRLDSIKHDTTQNHRSAFIFEEMRPAYNRCNIDRGTGVTARRKSILSQAIGTTRNPVLFTAIRSRLQKALSETNTYVTTTLDHDVSAILEQIRSNIELLRGSEARVLAKNGDFLDRLSLVVADLMKEMDLIGGIAARVKLVAEEHRAS